MIRSSMGNIYQKSYYKTIFLQPPGKEELMKFANDPYWVRMRWFLFICFWLIWSGMLFGAIAIIIYAPKCASVETQEYYQKSPLYEVDLKSFKDGDDKQDGYGDLRGETLCTLNASAATANFITVYSRKYPFFSCPYMFYFYYQDLVNSRHFSLPIVKIVSF